VSLLKKNGGRAAAVSKSPVKLQNYFGCSVGADVLAGGAFVAGGFAGWLVCAGG
jgi:hypothetical protein